MEDADVPEKVRIAYKNCRYIFENWSWFVDNKNPLDLHKILISINIVSKYKCDEKFLSSLSDIREEISKKCNGEMKEKMKIIHKMQKKSKT